LQIKNDIEGLGYDAIRNYLLLVCKEIPELIEEKEKKKKKEKPKYRAIYGYDLNKEVFLTEPLYRIALEAVADFVAKRIHSSEDKFQFKPSSIAIHPLDQKLYLTASEGNLLLVLNPDGSIYEACDLPPRMFKQPEGICFAPDGTMYISSEGRGENGYILQFNLIKP
jgi:uncharacterized protein YjiK